MTSPTAGTRRKKSKPARVKHVPVRTCIVCSEAGAKRGLTRIVRTPEGEVRVDPSGKLNGRGAYLCDKPGCWERAVTTPILARSLNVQVTQEIRDYIKEHAAGLLPPGADDDAGADSKEFA